MNNSYINLLNDMIVQGSVESREHMWYVQQYSAILAESYSKLFRNSRMTTEKQKLIALAASIHDIGKLSMPDSLLDKAGIMSMYEFSLYKKHTIKGGQVIKSLSNGRDKDFERICYNVCVYHHEKYDGSGYPYGIKADKIPVEAQIVGIADIYDTLVHHNFKEKIDPGRAFYMIVNGECGGISPKMVRCLEECRWELEGVLYKSA